MFSFYANVLKVKGIWQALNRIFYFFNKVTPIRKYKKPFVCFLFDNGSLRPDAFKQLRRIAQRLSEASGETVNPVSLLHSNKIDPDLLDGKPAKIVETALKENLEAGNTHFLLLPLFFGPSLALTDYFPKRIESLKKKYPDFTVFISAPLVIVEPHFDRVEKPVMVQILSNHVCAVIEEKGLKRPAVILVDHGTPVRVVNEVRHYLTDQLREHLGSSISCLQGASMESREGEAYAFNKPLLEELLSTKGFNSGDVVIALLFLLPGRHAGDDGDVASICTRAELRHPGLRTHFTALVGEHSGLITILEQRLAQGKKFFCSVEAK